MASKRITGPVKVLGISILLVCFLAAWGWAAGESEVRIKDVNPQSVLCIRGKAPVNEIGRAMGSLYGELFGYLSTQNIQPDGSPMALYHSPPPEIEFDVCVPIAGEAKDAGRIKAEILPGGQMASLTYVGPYENLAQPYDMIMKWMEKNGYEMAGPSREIYLIGPGQAKPQDFKTEILWPVMKK